MCILTLTPFRPPTIEIEIAGRFLRCGKEVRLVIGNADHPLPIVRYRIPPINIGVRRQWLTGNGFLADVEFRDYAPTRR